MSGFPAVVFTLICVFIVFSRKSANSERKKRLTQEEMINRQVGQTSNLIKTQPPVQSRPAPSQSSRPQGSAASRPASAAQAVAAARTGQNKAAGAPTGKNADSTGMSTTQMLAQKAELDQREHRKEEFEHKQHEKKYYGTYNYAERYLLGDPVPPTKKMVYCPNCAAENLIKLHENPAKYNCYFCREKLS